MHLIAHPTFEAARRRLRQELDVHRPGHMVFVIGPSGVGKTTIRRMVMQEMFGNPARWGRGRTPAVEAFAMLPRGAYFNSRDLARKLLDELNAPSLDWLMERSNLEASDRAAIRGELARCAKVWQNLRPKKATEGEYWDMIQRSIRARGCKYISIDQVTALLVNHRDTSPADHTLHLMSLAESSGVMFVMTGVHHAAKLWTVHPELRRRVAVVWIPPYSDRRPNDRPAFLRLLRTLGSKYPLSGRDLLLRMSYDILAATGGVFAEVVQLLERASTRARDEQSDRVLKRHIEDAVYSDADLKALWRDIEAFESVMMPGTIAKRSELAMTRWADDVRPAT